MIIKFSEKGKNHNFWETFKQFFYIGFYDWDEADYGFSIILFGYSFDWLVYRNKESFFEYQQLEYDREARYLRYEYENSLQEGK